MNTSTIFYGYQIKLNHKDRRLRVNSKLINFGLKPNLVIEKYRKTAHYLLFLRTFGIYTFFR